jgi:hypothetical protein
MASTNGVIFSESKADFLANPVDICFGSMPATSIAPAACLIIEGNAITSDRQIETDLSKKTHPPTTSDLIAGIDRVEDMPSDTIKICERVKRPRTSSMPLGLRNTPRVASRYMKRNIQIESGLYDQDRGSRGNYVDEPCPIHKNSKHTARQCRVLKMFRRPLTTAHHRRLNQESSLDRLAFQVAHTTISPNYPGEESETLDRQILVASADVPLQDGETDAQRQERDNANAARAVRRQQEIATNWLVSDRSTPIPRNKHLWHQQPHSNGAKMIHLMPIDYVREISSGISSATDLKSTIHHIPIWELLSLS